MKSGKMDLAFTDYSFNEYYSVGPCIRGREQVRTRYARFGPTREGVEPLMEAKLRAAHERSLQRLLGRDWVLDAEGVPTYLPARPRRGGVEIEAVQRRAEGRRLASLALDGGMKPSLAESEADVATGEPQRLGEAMVPCEAVLPAASGALS